MFIVNSVGKIMGLFFFFTFVTLATFKAIFNNNNFLKEYISCFLQSKKYTLLR